MIKSPARFIIKLLTLFVCLTPLTNAAVLEKSPSHFVLEITTITEVSRDAAFAQFTRIHEWWDAQHSWFGAARNFSLDTSAGGCFCEIDGDRQVQHMTVSFINPGHEIRLLGGLGPLQMMAVTGAMSWQFEPLADGRTQITQRYTVLGDDSQALDKLAPIVDSVQSGQQAALMSKLAQISN